ncbi:MAG: malto-oligosyltrehalose synthase [Candidatus Limnocylindrales bacterium]
MTERRRLTRVVPSSTYRLQLRPAFGFSAAADVGRYLARLGVSHVYSSPYLQAAPGSEHGYDVVDPRRVNEELGGARAHRRMSNRLAEVGLGQVLDIVPNHMAISGPENPWWWDVLENGPSSRYAPYFDVDWDPPEARERNSVLLPILGDHYGRVVESGELQLERHGGTISLRYHEHVLPLSPRSLYRLLGPAAVRSRSNELAYLSDAFRALPRSSVTDRDSILRRHRDKEVLRAWLTRLLDERPRVRDALDAQLAATAADPDQLDGLLSIQNYRIAFWRSAGSELGYRRFFDVTSLIGLRVEDPAVFDDSHARLKRWIDRGVLDGIRVDHPDGLLDPTAYTQRLRRTARRGWLVVEKILMPGETLPSDWPVDGTTGYDFLRDTVGLFVDPDAEDALTELHRRVTGEEREFDAVTLETRALIARETLGSEVNRLAAVFVDICENQRRFRDFTRNEMQEAIIAVATSMPVYRTYARPREGEVSDADLAVIEQAVSSARERHPDIDPELLTFLADILSLRVSGEAEAELTERFQQFTGAVMAKGIEDTAFYRYLRLVALNDVGCEPGHFGTSIAAYHAANIERAAMHPTAMLTTSTHDTKRSEDVRVRIAALSEAPERWRRIAERWMRRFRRSWRGSDFDPTIGYLAAQTLVGAWPIDADRFAAYLLKAAREAKLRTSWTQPDAAYETALDRFSRSILADPAFVSEVERSIASFVRAGRVNSLSQSLLKLTSPGVPDIYQGTELWDLSLVDPDNRRAVDFELRERFLTDLEDALGSDPLRGPGADALLAAVETGLPKLWVIRQALALRGRRPGAFAPEASYRPLTSSGRAADHVVAFARADEIVTVTPRLPLRLARGRIGARLVAPATRWADTRVELPPGRWRDVLTGDRLRVTASSRGLRVARVLGHFPVALLEREDA